MVIGRAKEGAYMARGVQVSHFWWGSCAPPVQVTGVVSRWLNTLYHSLQKCGESWNTR